MKQAMMYLIEMTETQDFVYDQPEVIWYSKLAFFLASAIKKHGKVCLKMTDRIYKPPLTVFRHL